jgi:hypothetical protein
MTDTHTIKLLHVAMDVADGGSRERVDIVRPEGSSTCVVSRTQADGRVVTSSLPFKGLDHYRDEGFEVTFEKIDWYVENAIMGQLREEGLTGNFVWVSDEATIGKLYWYVVEGVGNFLDGVSDMLRRDRSRPASSHDAEVMKADFDNPLRHTKEKWGLVEKPRRIKLVTSHKNAAPLTKRWESFGWKVVELDPEIWWSEVSKPVGRPRIHPEGTTAADRAKVSNEELKRSGGARRTFALSKEALDALALIRSVGGDANDTAAVERVLKDVARDINLSY